jgi:hypothetical protein
MQARIVKEVDMVWLILAFLLLLLSWSLPLADPYQEKPLLQVLIVVIRGIGMVMFGFGLGTLCG